VSGAGKRLFLAVDLDEQTRETVARLSTSLRERAESLGRITWVHKDRMHLTVHFVGHADEALEQRVRSALAEPVPLAPFSLSFKGIGFFPASGSPRVLWLGIADGLRDMRRLHECVERRLDVPGGAGEAFNPHLTLARFRDRVPRRQLAGIAGLTAAAGPCLIDRVTLYESRLSPGGLSRAESKGPTYVPLAESLLNP
jgi:2'-5' RNA ligase